MSSKLGSLTLDLVARTSNFTKGVKQASASMDAEMKKVERSAASAENAINSLAIKVGTAFSVIQVANYADEYTGMVNKLKLVTNNQLELQSAMSDTHRIAQSTASDWASVLDVYTKFQKISEQVGLSQAEVSRVTETVTKAVGMSGASADEAQRSLVQFSQALSVGVLKGQDLNSVMQQTPGLTDAIARGMGVTSDKLKALGSDGVLTTEAIIQALKGVSRDIDDDFSKTATTIASSFSLIKNESIRMAGEFDAATESSKRFVDGITLVSDNMGVIVGGAAVGGVALLTRAVLNQVLAAKEAITTSIARRAADTALAESQVRLAALEVQRTKQVTALALTEVNLARAEYNNATTRNARALATQRLTAAEIALSIAEKQGKAAVDASTASQNALNASRAIGARILGLVGGPIGAITLGVTALAAGYMLLKNSTDTSTESLMKNNETVDAAIKKYQDLSDVKKKSQLVDEKESLKDLSDEYENISSKLIATTLNFSKSNDMTREQARSVSTLAMEFKRTKDLDLFSKKINDLGFINQESKDKFNKLAGAVSDSSKEYKEQLRLLNGINGVSGLAVQGSKDRANAADKEKAAIEGVKEAYDKYRQSAFADIKEMSARAMLQNRGLSDNQVAERLKVLKALDYKPELVNSDQGKALISLAKISADMKDKEDARAEAIKKSTQKTKADTAAKREAAKAERDLNQAIDDSRRLLYEYGNEFKRIRIDQKTGTDRILNSLLPAETKADFIRDLGEISLARQQLYAKEYEYDLDSWMWSANKKLEKEKEIEKSRILSLTGMTKNERNERIKSFEDQYKHAMVLQDLEDKGRFQSASEFFLKESEIILKRHELEREQIIATYQLNDKLRSQLLQLNKMQQIAQRDSMSDQVRQYGADANYEMYRRNDPAQYGQWQGSVAQYDMQNAYSTSMSGLDSAYSDQVAGINMLENEEQRNAELLAAHEQYLQAREALDAQYQQAEQDNQMAMHASNLSAYSSAFGSMADMVKGYAGEASGAYQALASVQKAANLASVIMNGYTTISAAWASAPFPANLANVALATAKTGVLQAAMQAFTPNIQGMAHNGIDNIPKEGTWLLDGGERVLNPQQNKDLTNYLANSKGGGGDVQITQTIVFSDGSAKVDTQGQKELAQSLNNMMDAWARRNVKQGGALYNLIRS